MTEQEWQDYLRVRETAPKLLAALEAAGRWVAQYHDMPGHDAASRSMSRVINEALREAGR
jgi:hypothetical protein